VKKTTTFWNPEERDEPLGRGGGRGRLITIKGKEGDGLNFKKPVLRTVPRSRPREDLPGKGHRRLLSLEPIGGMRGKHKVKESKDT